MLNWRVKRKAGILAALVMLAVPSVVSGDEFSSMSKSVMQTPDRNELFITGRWAAVADTGDKIPIPKANTVNVICKKKSMTCTETVAMFYGPDEIDQKPYPQDDMIIKMSYEYRVVEWTSTAVFARWKAAATDTGLRISLPDERVQRICRETKEGSESGGNQEGGQDVFRQWVLE